MKHEWQKEDKLEDELIRRLFYNTVEPEEAKFIAQQLLKKRLKNGNLIILVELLYEYELEGKIWARKLRLKAIRKLKKIHPQSEAERKYIQRVIEEYGR